MQFKRMQKLPPDHFDLPAAPELFFGMMCQLKYEIYLIYSGCVNISSKELKKKAKVKQALKFHNSKFKISWVDKTGQTSADKTVNERIRQY